MRVFFNDLSTGNSEMSLIGNFDKVHRFSELISHLNKTIGIKVIATSENFYALRLCDTQVSECMYKEDFDFDKRNLIEQLFNYFQLDQELDEKDEFIHLDSGKRSSLLGKACKNHFPTISFTFHDIFSYPEIKGELNGKSTTIFNLFDKTQKLPPSNFITSADCKQFDPTLNPLWNIDCTKSYHNSIKQEIDSITKYPDNKIAILERHSSNIAELNGWELDEGLTKRNRTNNQFRRIFRSSKFTRGKGYLSIDFEKSDIFFELHDKNGRHLGEYRWDGTLNKGPDASGRHNILIK